MYKSKQLKGTTQGSAKSHSKSASAEVQAKTDGCIAVHRLIARLSWKHERYMAVNAYISCHLDEHLCCREATR
jgi:hypothetical protein